MATKKVIDMTARGSSTLAFNDFVYLTKEVPLTDEKMQASVMRDYVLSGIKTNANSGLAQTSTAYAFANPDYELSVDVNNLTTVGGTASTGDYIAIDQGAGTKKLLVGDLPFASSASSVASITGGDGITASSATGAVTLSTDLKANGGVVIESGEIAVDLGASSITGTLDNADLTNSSVSYGGVSLSLGGSDATPAFNLSDATAYTGDSSLVTTGTVTSGTWEGTTIAVDQGGTGMTSIAKGGVIVSSAADTFSALLGGVGEDGYVLTYNESPDTLTWEPHAGSAGTVSSVASGSGLTGGPITGSGTLSVELTANGGLEPSAGGVSGTLQVAQGISQYDVAQFNASVVDDDFLRIDGTAVEGRSASEVLTDIAASPVAGSSSIVTVGTLSSGTIEGTSVLSTTETGTAKFLRVDGDNSSSWQVPPDTNTTYTAGDGLDLTGTTFSTDLMANGGLEITTTELSVAVGISQYDVAQFSTGVVDDDFLRIDGTAVEGRSASEVKSDIGLGNVENTALSTWAGSTNVTTLGTIATGTWEGTTVALDQGGTGMTSIAKGSVLVANAANTLSAASGVTDGHVLTYTSASDTVGWGAVPAAGVTAGFSIAMAVAL